MKSIFPIKKTFNCWTKFRGFSPNSKQTASAFKPIGRPPLRYGGCHARFRKYSLKEGIAGLEKIPGVALFRLTMRNRVAVCGNC
jgi:hypothetical protein